jgi:signal transduction histidine kinase
MPVLDGLGMLDAIRANPATSTLPVILLSARAGEEARVQGLAARADDYLVKPFTARELLARVEVHLSLAHMRKQEARRVRETIEAELKGMTRLHEVVSRLLAAPDVRSALGEILVATCAMMGSQMGNVQVYDPHAQTLTIAAQQGFSQDLLDQLGVVRRDSPSACSAAMNSLSRVIIEDVNQDESFRPLRDIAAAAGFRSIQSTPLLSRTGALLGVLSTHWSHPHRPSERELYMLDLYAREAADVLENIQAAQELQRSCDQLRALSGRLLRLEDEERRRLARELHDTTAQWLAALSMNLSVLSESAGLLNPRARTAMAESAALADRCLREIRTVSYLLHPHELDELGLESALSRYIDGFIRRSGIQVEVEVPSDLGRVPQAVETAVFRVVQESLTNIRRHAGSATARVRLLRSPSNLVLEVSDAGRGIGDDAPSGVGIASMRERVEQLNGRLEIASHSSGTKVKATIPLSSSV